MTYTVVIRNTMLGTKHGTGKFASKDAAANFARSESRRTRAFMIYEVWTGTPRAPLAPTDVPPIKGEQ